MTVCSELKIKLAVIGLGYVGLPLAVEFAKKRSVLGYDISVNRIQDLRECHDSTMEISLDELKQSRQGLSFTSNLDDIAECNFFIVTVPTPIDQYKQPDFQPLLQASAAIGTILKSGDIVVYESTVYPGAIEQVCVPVLAESSRLKFNQDFFVGYSPERVSPGDKLHTVTKIQKLTSGSTPIVAEIVDSLYREIIIAGTHKTSSIKVAEAAKVIENTQRDLNIALMNELSIIFNKIGIDTEEVLQAAGTKWNFLPFRPGLVGGHCIGVDPYYLTHLAQSIGHHPEIILAGRRLNDNMGIYVVSQLIKKMLKLKIHIEDARVLILGLTFKENCPDIRNTRVIDVINELHGYAVSVDVYDPWANSTEVRREYGFDLITQIEPNTYDGIILAVAHDDFRTMGVDNIRVSGRDNHILYDLKYLFPASASDLRL